MSKKTLTLIIFLVGLTIVLFVIALTSGTKPDTQLFTVTQPSPTPVAQTVLSISPSTMAMTATRTATVDVLIDASMNDITGVQLEISYDPKVFTNVLLKPGTFLPSAEEIIPNQVDAKNGRVTYALFLPQSQKAVRGTGIVATLSFSQKLLPVLPTGVGEISEIKILPKSLVTAEGIRKSVLKSETGTTIKLFTNQTTITPSPKVTTKPSSNF